MINEQNEPGRSRNVTTGSGSAATGRNVPAAARANVDDTGGSAESEAGSATGRAASVERTAAIGARAVLIAEMERQSVSQGQLARLLGVTRSAVTQALRDPSLRQMQRFAAQLGCTVRIEIERNN